jgi:hypothetical protein
VILPTEVSVKLTVTGTVPLVPVARKRATTDEEERILRFHLISS